MTIKPLDLRPWGPEADDAGLLHSSARVFAISALSVGSIAIVTEITINILSATGVFPSQGFFGWIGGLGSLRTFVLSGGGMGLLCTGAVLTALQRHYKTTLSEKAEKNWIEERKKTRNGKVFLPEDKPLVDGFEWEKPGQKRVLIISSKEGGGHKTAAEAYKTALKAAGYATKIIYPTEEYSNAKWFNYCQKKRWRFLQKAMIEMQPIGEKLGVFAPVYRKIQQEILLFQPQLMISVQPIANDMTVQFAENYAIPTIIAPTDYKIGHFFYEIPKKPHPLITVALPLPLEDNETTTFTARSLHGFEDRNFRVIGYPIREAFQKKNQENLIKKAKELKEKYNLTEDDYIVPISGGAQGGKQVFDYCKEIGEYNKTAKKQIHAFALCGNNQQLQKDITNLNAPGIHVIDFTPDMAYYMKMGKVYDTKPGGASTSEGWAVGAYMYFNKQDAETTPWEPVNMGKVIAKGRGEAIVKKTFVSRLVEILEDKNLTHLSFPDEKEFPGVNFNENAVNLANELTSS